MQCPKAELLTERTPRHLSTPVAVRDAVECDMSQWIQQWWLVTAHVISMMGLLAMCYRESRRADRWERSARAMAATRAMHEAKTRVWRSEQ